MKIRVNNEAINLEQYEGFHKKRFDVTMDIVRSIGGSRVVELGGHPWAMTARLLREPDIELIATVSAEEETAWPDELPSVKREYTLDVDGQDTSHFFNYSANIERTQFPLDEKADIVLACEIIEHMMRSPHIMLLNANSWLDIGGYIVITTPNGSQLENPFRVRPKMPAYRYSSYSRHNYVFTLDGLIDLVSACGFEIVSAEYFSPYERKGLSDLYRGLMKIPGEYAKAKFAQSLCVVARKMKDCDAADRLPKVYVPSPDWERLEQVKQSIDVG
ncbi:methyltransferase domain-containing protein [Pseudomonadota bacterium]